MDSLKYTEIAMNHYVLTVVTACALTSVAPSSAWAQDSRQSLASADVLSQISMFNYEAGPKSELVFRGTPIAAECLRHSQCRVRKR